MATVLVAGGMAGAQADVVVLPPLADGAKRTRLTSAGGRLFAVTEDGAERGLATIAAEAPFASTALVDQVRADYASLQADGDGVLFIGSTSGGLRFPGRSSLWVSDGTIAGTSLYATAERAMWARRCAGSLFVVNGGFDMIRWGGQLWRDGDVIGSYGAASVYWDVACLAGDVLLLAASSVSEQGGVYTAQLPDEVLETAGARQFVAQRAAVFAGHQLGYATVMEGRQDGPYARGTSIVRTDGTDDGTFVLVHVTDVDREVRVVDVIGDRAYYIAPDDAGFDALWTTEGAAGDSTAMLQLADAASLRVLGRFGSTLFFAMGPTLWRSDGTAEGTFRIFPPWSAAAVQSLVATDDAVYLGVHVAGGNAELWRADGTIDGFERVRALPGPTVELARAGEHVFVLSDPVPPPPPPPPPPPVTCNDAAVPLACELDGLAASLTCDGEPALRPRQAKKLARLAQRIAGDDARAARKASHRAAVTLDRLQRRFGARRTIARLGADCASTVAAALQAARDRIAARRLGATAE
jgi:hypothetical protein